MAYLFPSFTSSDKSLDMTYAYRCEVYQKHIKKTPAGYVITEFLPDVPWAGKYNTISCAASHHFREGRWLNDPTPLAEYARFWCTEGNPRLYSFPLAESILALERVTGNCSLGDELYPALLIWFLMGLLFQFLAANILILLGCFYTRNYIVN